MTELVQPIKRVEQYLYALCVLDFSNIPVPRSRLEIFTHAMITGEVPEIAPETREEEYMVAIIKGDVANLPTPKSRADHLLYRICLGETEIRDIELETRYEMLLAYLAEHGETDLEYALINFTKAFETLYNTVEMPVKSAILTGQTLVNIKGEESNDVPIGGYSSHDFLIPLVKKNTDYLIKYDTTLSGGVLAIGFLNNSGGWSNNSERQPNIGLIRLNSGEYPNYFRIIAGGGQTVVINNLMIIEYQDGMENWDIPFFTGMKSVKMPVLTTTSENIGYKFKTTNGLLIYTSGVVNPNNSYFVTDFIKMDNNTYSYYIGEDSRYSIYDVNKKYISGSSDKIIKKPSNGYYMKICGKDENLTLVEYSKVLTGHLPNKSNILRTPSDLELRGIGDVKDTLNCLTGELTERVGEIVLDGSENWSRFSENRFHLIIGNWKLAPTTTINAKADKINVVPYPQYQSSSLPNISRYNGNNYGIFLYTGGSGWCEDDVTSLKTKLQSNPITVQYELTTESIKTVDLTIQDQDNQPTQLKTFNDVTHIGTQADSVLPTVILEYGTKNEEVLAALSQDHEEVADAQAALSDAIDSQSDEVETTMMALTEVYEGGN